MLIKRILLLGCLSVIVSSSAMNYSSPSNDDFRRLNKMYVMVSVDKNKILRTAEEWMKQAAIYQARAYMAGAMGLPQNYDGMEAYVCCEEAKKLNDQIMKCFDYFEEIKSTLTRVSGEFKQYIPQALQDLNDEKEVFQMIKK